MADNRDHGPSRSATRRPPSTRRFNVLDRHRIFFTPEVLAGLIHRAAEMELTSRLADRDAIMVSLTGFLTALAMNYVYKGNFVAK